MSAADSRELNDQERLFVEFYCTPAPHGANFSATRAAKMAGYSERSAHAYGPRLLQSPRIRAAIDARLEELTRLAGIETLRILQETAAIAFLDPREAITWGQGVVLEDSDRIPEHVARAVAEVAETTDRAGNIHMKLKFHSKVKALELLGRYKNLFNRVEVTGKDGGPIDHVHALARRAVEDAGAAELAHELLERVAGDPGGPGLAPVGEEVGPGSSSPAPEPEAH